MRTAIRTLILRDIGPFRRLMQKKHDGVASVPLRHVGMKL
jgi:hypothetical protein